MSESRRRLPHQYPEGKWIFATWRLHGSLPPARYPPPGKMSAGQAFVWIDRYLHTTREGPMYLEQAIIARIVVDSLYRGVQLRHYELGPWVIMPNHVHALLLPKIPVPKLLKALKGSTAREANRILNRAGEPFWQAESYDHWVRNDEELARITRYIEQNPVKAGLVRQAEDFPWSSASVGISANAAGTSARATS